MTIENLVAFNALLIVAIISPGPAFLVALRMTLARGSRAGLAAGAGLAVFATLWTAAALWGLDAAFRLFPWAWGTARTLGGGYLLWLGWRTWRSAKQAPDETAPSRKSPFVTGALVNLMNPKSMLFATAVLLAVFPAPLGNGARAIVLANHLMLELAFYSALALLMGRSGPRAAYLRARARLDRIAGAVLALFGLRLLMPDR